MNNRRKLLVALGAGALTAPLAAFAQAGKVWRVGFLAGVSRPSSLEEHRLGGFLRGMRELGYIEGKNLVIEWRFADGRDERLPSLAAELVGLKVDVIVAGSGQATRALQKATPTIPIVMGNAGDPVGFGFVRSLARPGGNITGLSSITVDLTLKNLEMLISMAPKVSRVAILMNPTNPDNVAYLKNLQTAAQRPNVTIMPVEATTTQEIENAFSTMTREKAEAVVVMGGALNNQHLRQIAELAAKHRLPSITLFRDYAEAGGLMTYGASIGDNYRRAATYVDKIFKGAKPGDLPVEQPMKFELFINGKTAKALGLTIPQSLLIMADKVIE